MIIFWFFFFLFLFLFFFFLVLSLFGFFGFSFSSPVSFNVFFFFGFSFCFSYFFLFGFFFDSISSFFSFSSSFLLELVWTSIPIFILLFLFFPSVNYLVSMDNFSFFDWGLKIMAHQWYWSYEYFNGYFFDSVCCSFSDLDLDFILLDCDNVLVVPLGVPGSLLVTSFDVIHSWGVPSLGLKVDAVPGKLNQIYFLMDSMGFYYGQCYELCGTNHSFMPISMEVLFWEDFLDWLFFSSF